MGSILGLNGEESRQGRTRVRTSKAQGPGRGTAVIRAVLAKHFLSIISSSPSLAVLTVFTESKSQGTGTSSAAKARPSPLCHTAAKAGSETLD